jgi:phage baseplate assembly protein W
MDRPREHELLRKRLLGRGLRCAPTAPGLHLGRDLVFDASNGDLAIVDGADNLAQALAIALTTPLGGDVFNIDYGFDGLNAMTEESSPVLVQERIRIAVISLLQKDPRVARIVDVRLEDGRLSTPGAGNRVLNVKVVFETVSGNTATVDLGEVIRG